MSIEEQQQIEIAQVLQAPDTVEKIPDSLGRHSRCCLAEAPKRARPLTGGQEATQIGSVSV